MVAEELFMYITSNNSHFVF